MRASKRGKKLKKKEAIKKDQLDENWATAASGWAPQATARDEDCTRKKMPRVRFYLVYFIIIKRLNFRIVPRAHFDSLDLDFTFFFLFPHELFVAIRFRVWQRKSFIICSLSHIGIYRRRVPAAKYAISNLESESDRSACTVGRPCIRSYSKWTSIRFDNKGHHSLCPPPTHNRIAHAHTQSTHHSLFICIGIHFQLIYLFSLHELVCECLTATTVCKSRSLFLSPPLLPNPFDLFLVSSFTSSPSDPFGRFDVDVFVSFPLCVHLTFRRLIWYGVNSSS